VINKSLHDIPFATELDENALNRLQLAHVFDPWAALTFLDSVVATSSTTTPLSSQNRPPVALDLLLVVGLDQLLGPLQEKREGGSTGGGGGGTSSIVTCEPLLAALLLRLRHLVSLGATVIVCSGLLLHQTNIASTASAFYESFDIVLALKPGPQVGFFTVGKLVLL